MYNVTELYSEFCSEKGIPFQIDNKISSYDDTTLFCPAGMQQFKKQFKDQSIVGVTKANIQSCLRLNDLDNIGDETHFLCFDMIGLFSFRGLTVKQAIDFWIEFLDTKLNLKPDYVTVHPDKSDWSTYYNGYDVEIRGDQECVWSDGELSGYCTEFYYKGVEIGNIVNICGDCIDVGFGLERLTMAANNTDPSKTLNGVERLTDAIQRILNEGYVPSNKQHGYVLRRLMRVLYKKGGSMYNTHFHAEVGRQKEILQKYSKLKERYKDKPKEWWFDTHGIDLDMVE
jgi:alanyl-tRNA synthetase